jgi:hypothetical protein
MNTVTNLLGWIVDHGTAIVALLGGTSAVCLLFGRKLLKRQVVYAARVAELMQPPQVGFRLALEDFLPLPVQPSYSDFSSQSPNYPPRALTDRRAIFEGMKEILSDVALEQARAWEAIHAGNMTLLGDMSEPYLRLYQTWVRLRWHLIGKCQGDYSKVAADIGQECAVAIEKLECLKDVFVNQLPTRILVIKVENRSINDARDLTVDVTSGGEVYDVVVNDQLSEGKINRSNNRILVTWPIMQPRYVVEVKIWYVWRAVAFGSRMGSQSDRFPRHEGIIINHIGTSNSKARRYKSLLRDMNAWNSRDITIGKERSW